MHKKGRTLIKKAMKEKKLKGLNEDCEYLPCHDGLEDCTFCYCPFYPCYQTDTGGFEKISSKTGNPVWSCSNCILNHIKENALKILTGLLEFEIDFDLISREDLLNLRKKILKRDDD